MACQPKREHQTTVADSDGNCCIIHPSTRDPRPHRQSRQIVPGGGGIPAHDRSADFQSAYPVLPCRDSLGPRPRPFSRGAETQNHSKTPAIKPHQTPSAGGGKERRFAIRLPPLVPWPFNFGLWPLDIGLWPLDFGLWPLDFGLWISDRPKQSDGFRRSRPHTIRPQNDASR
jgi:hypothetical protein